MVEVIVSAVLLIVLAMATLPLLDQAGERSGSNKSRGVASALAQADQDRMRQMTIDDLANYTAQRTKTVEGIQYTIDSEARWVRDASGFVTCAVDPSRAEYVKVMSTVRWPRMNGIDPIIVESFVAPGVTALGPAKGTLTVKLQNAAGGPQPGIPVTAGGLAGVTDAAGCYVFAQLNSGSNTVAFNSPGYVDRKHVQNSTQTVNVAGGATSQLTDMYDKAVTLTSSFKLEDGTATSWRSLSVATSGSGVTSPVEKTSASAVSGLDTQGLFPTTSGYGAYAGRSTCTMNEPSQYRADYYSAAGSPYRTSFVNSYLSSPTKTPVDTFLRRNTVTITNTSANAGTSWVSATPTGAGTSCESFARTSAVAQGGTTKTGIGTLDLPWGTWTLCADDGSKKKTITGFKNFPTGSATAPSTAAQPINLSSGTTTGTCP
jgi:hypothetical protein